MCAEDVVFRLQGPITVDGNDVYSVRGVSESLRKPVEVSNVSGRPLSLL